MIHTDIVIPSWVSVINQTFYDKLVSNVEYFNAHNTIVSIPSPIPGDPNYVDPAVAWLAEFSALVSALSSWRAADRGWNNMIYILTTLGFDISAFTDSGGISDTGAVNTTITTGLPSNILTLMESSKYTNIFNFQGLVEASQSWGDDYLLNNNNMSHLTTVVSKIAGAATYENTTVETITHEMTHLMQMRALDKMLKTDPAKTLYFDYMQSLPLYLTNNGDYDLPTSKP